MMPEKKKIDAWQEELKILLSNSRYLHSLRVAELARRLAHCWRMNSEKAYLAGLFHDIGRSLNNEELVEAAQSRGVEIGPAEKANPNLLHAPIGALLLSEKWQVKDEEILKAVAGHTLAKANMEPLVKIVYLADILDPGRKYPDPYCQNILALARRDLDQAMLVAIDRTLAWLKSEKSIIHPDIWAARKYYRRKVTKINNCFYQY